MVDFLCHDGVCAHQVGEETCDGMWWGEGISTWVSDHCWLLSNNCALSMPISIHFLSHTSNYHLRNICLSWPLSFGWFHFSGSSHVNLFLGHQALKKMTRKIVFGNLRRKSPETVSSLLPRSPNKSRGGGWRRTPHRWMLYQKTWLLRRSW